MSLNLATANGTLQALLAASAITWSLQLTFAWRAFDHARRTRGVGVTLLTSMIIGLIAVLAPLAALTLQSLEETGTAFHWLFWTSIISNATFVVASFGVYLLLVLVFMQPRP